MTQDIGELTPLQMPEGREILQLRERLQGVTELGGADLVRKEPVKGPLFDREQLHLILGPHGCASRRGAEKTQFPEGLPTTKRVQDFDFSRVRVLCFDPDSPAAYHEESGRTLALPEDGLARMERTEPDVTCQVRQQFLWQALERWKCVDELGRLYAP